MQAVEFSKIHRTEQRDDLTAVRGEVVKLIDAMAPTSVSVSNATVGVKKLYISYDTPPTRAYLAAVVGQLSVREAGYIAAEGKAALAAESARVAAEDKAKSDAAARRAAEATAAQAAEAVRLEAEARAQAEKTKLIAQQQAAEAEAAKQRNIAEARMLQRALDRLPRFVDRLQY